MEQSDIIKLIAALIVFVIVVFVLYYYYNLYFSNYSLNKYKLALINDETTFDETYELKLQTNAMITDRPSFLVPGMGYGLSVIWEMNIPTLASNDKWESSYNRLKPIIAMNDSPVVSYHPKKNYISIVLKYRDNPFYAQFAEVKFDNVKVQGWHKYILIIENRTIKLYVDGTLLSTKVLPSLPVIYDTTTSEIVLGDKDNNFQGKVRKMNMFPFPLKYDDLDKV